ncbi:2Fe-2S iron-sulfur cluster-binding protein [Morganella morganii]
MTDSYDLQSITLQVLNRGQIIRVDTKKTILDNLLLHNIFIRNKCRSGICGSCKFRLKSGHIRSEPDFCLSVKDKEQHIYLACCSFPESDTVIEIL